MGEGGGLGARGRSEGIMAGAGKVSQRSGRRRMSDGGVVGGVMGRPQRPVSPSLKLLKASEHLANCSSPRDSNEINSEMLIGSSAEALVPNCSLFPSSRLLHLAENPQCPSSSHMLLCREHPASKPARECSMGKLIMELCCQGNLRA